MTDPIRIEGLIDFQKALRQLDAELPKQMRLVNRDAAEIAAAATRQSFASRGGVAPKVVASIKVLAQQRSAAVKIGGQKWPYAMGSNFGSNRYKQFPPPAKPDYSLYTSLDEKREQIIESYGDALDRLSRRAFPQ